MVAHFLWLWHIVTHRMGLDDFKSDSPSDDKLEKKLSNNSPPGDEDTWPEHEPGVPDWTEEICGDEVDSEAVDKYENDQILYIKLDHEDKNGSDHMIVSDVYIDLDSMD